MVMRKSVGQIVIAGSESIGEEYMVEEIGWNGDA